VPKFLDILQGDRLMPKRLSKIIISKELKLKEKKLLKELLF
jgi:hypothetical protein